MTTFPTIQGKLFSNPLPPIDTVRRPKQSGDPVTNFLSTVESYSQRGLLYISRASRDLLWGAASTHLSTSLESIPLCCLVRLSANSELRSQLVWPARQCWLTRLVPVASHPRETRTPNEWWVWCLVLLHIFKTHTHREVFIFHNYNCNHMTELKKPVEEIS